MNILEFPYINSYTYMLNACSSTGYRENPVTNWLLYGKIKENIIVTPTDKDQVITATGKNRELESVTVKAM